MEGVPLPSRTAVTWKVKLFLELLFLLISLDVARSKQRWLAALNVVLWVVPVAIGSVVVERAGGDALPRNLILSQMMLCGELGFLLAVTVEVVIMVVGALLLFKSEINHAMSLVVKVHSKLRAYDKGMIHSTIGAYVKTINVDKLVVYALFLAFIVAASVEEFVE